MHARTLALTLAVVAAAATAQEPAEIVATRAAKPIAVDGRLDEADWQRAEPFSAFVQIFPGDGVAPSAPTQVRVLLGTTHLYVGIRCDQAEGTPISRPLGRRDKPPPSDVVKVLVDAGNSGRSALLFSVTAAGVQSDAIAYDDDQTTYEWDSAWDSAVEVDGGGWTAELAIPLSAFPRAPADGATWRFGVVREVASTHERMATFHVPRETGGMVSRLGSLSGLSQTSVDRDVEVTSYLAQRAVVRPQFSDPATPGGRITDVSTDLGFDVRANLGRSTLTATLNPDFGQVEADQIILNLSSFEALFPEKRPFFNEGAEAFQSVGTGRESVPHRMFYSRRIGLDVPILGAAKLVGDVGDGAKVAFLDAVVSDAGQPAGSTEASPDRSFGWSAARPMHLGPADARPALAPAPQNFFAGVARTSVGPGLSVGALATAATPLTAECTTEQDARDVGRPTSCDARGGQAAALDFNAASADGVWYAYGQASGSRSDGGPPERLLRDGTVLHRGELGTGAYLRAGKRGGEPFRFDLGWTYASPTLDLNASGFQRTQNEQEGAATLRLVKTQLGPFHELRGYVKGYTRFTTDGRGLERGRGVETGFYAIWREPYLTANCWLNHDDPEYDVREIAGTGIPFRRTASETATCELITDEAKPVSLDLYGYVGRNLQVAGLGAPGFHGAFGAVAVRPHARLETRLELNYDHFAYPARYTGEPGVFAELTAPTASVTLRQLVAFTPRLTFQLYGQLFTSYQQWGPFYGATAAAGAAIEPGALQRIPGRAGFDAHTTALVLNAVLRWEYRTGSTLWLVYARNQTELPGATADAAPRDLGPHGLGGGPTVDSLMVKWSHRIGG
ncbi:MAG TPA: DUF5916 domain-containing protein [Anaeromyxobacteraceae bacterium]|nr:DUF5916 domain-containing protein [Anaeromyxobacteraceae bacterium]